MAIDVQKIIEKIRWIVNGEPDLDEVYNRPLLDYLKLLKDDDPDLKAAFEEFFSDSKIGNGGSTKMIWDTAKVSKDVVPGDAVYIDYSGMICKAIGEKNIKSRVAGIFMLDTDKHGNKIPSIYTGGIIENFPFELEVGKFYYLSLEEEGKIQNNTEDDNGEVIPYTWVVGLAKSQTEFIVRVDYLCPCNCNSEEYWGDKQHPNFIDNDMMGSWIKKEYPFTAEPNQSSFPFGGDPEAIMVFVEGLHQNWSSVSVTDGQLSLAFDFKGGESVYIIEFATPIIPKVEKVHTASLNATYIDFGQKFYENSSFVFVEGVLQFKYHTHIDKKVTDPLTKLFNITENTGRFAFTTPQDGIHKNEVACLGMISGDDNGHLERGLKHWVTKKSNNPQNRFELAKELVNPMVFVNGIFQVPEKDYRFLKEGDIVAIDFVNELIENDEILIMHQIPEPKK